MTTDEYRIMQDGISASTRAMKGKNIYYKCTKCGDIIPSHPRDNMGCKCDNVFIDIDCFRLVVKEYSHFQVLEKVKAK